MTGPSQLLSNESKFFLIVILGGVFGGIGSVIQGWEIINTTGFFNFHFIWEMLFVPSLMGGIAAILGVYLFSPSMPDKKARAFAFAIACGLAFPTWIAKTGSLAEEAQSHVLSSIAQDTQNELNKIINSGTPEFEVIAKQLNELGDLASFKGATNSDDYYILSQQIKNSTSVDDDNLKLIKEKVDGYYKSSFKDNKIDLKLLSPDLLKNQTRVVLGGNGVDHSNKG